MNTDFTKPPTRLEVLKWKPHLTGWNKLNEVFKLDLLSVKDLEAMLRIELHSHARPELLRRLIARLHSAHRKELTKDINQWLKNHGKGIIVSKKIWRKRSVFGARKMDTTGESSYPHPTEESQTGSLSLQQAELDFSSSNARGRNQRTCRSKK